MAELAATSANAACGGFSEHALAQRSKKPRKSATHPMVFSGTARVSRGADGYSAITLIEYCLYAGVAELAATSANAACGGFSEHALAQRSKKPRKRCNAPDGFFGHRKSLAGADGYSAITLTEYCLYAGVAELADAPDLGSGVYDVGVQVPSPAPKHSNPNLLPIGETFGFVVFLNEIA